jgi:translation initiation factor IF-3
MAIDHHDVVIKTNQVKSFIEKGHPVRLFIKLKNREKARPEAAVEKLQSVVDMLKSHIQVDKISQSPGFVYIVVHPIQGKTNVQKAD